MLTMANVKYGEIPSAKSLKDNLKKNKKVLLLIFSIALMLRLAFSFYFQQFYFGEYTFKYKDTSTYLLPVLNLIEHGVYQGDLFLDDSKYFRMPVYPAFLGLVHTIFGAEYLDYAVAFVQSLLDAISAGLVFLIVLRISTSVSSSVISSLVYAAYPFVILWVPISYTEIVQIFNMWTVILIASYFRKNNLAVLIQGVLCGLLILTKQYMGVILLVPLLSIVLTQAYHSKIKMLVYLVIGFALPLTPWIARNYIASGNIIVLRGETTGLRSVGRDFESFYKFAALFDENVTPAVYEVAYKGTMTFTSHIDFVEKNKQDIDEALLLAHQCGDSFVQWRKWIPINEPPYEGCADDVAQKFDDLRGKFWKQVNICEALQTRIDSVKKIFLKNKLVSTKIKMSKSDLLQKAIFIYRVLLLSLGVAGIILVMKKSVLPLILLSTSLSFYCYFTFVIVHAEMRYLLIPDLLITVFVGVSIAEIVNRFKQA
ncbi:hypothetical protein GMJAKD_12300 [Candidatus Electrothrix aarhusensis]